MRCPARRTGSACGVGQWTLATGWCGGLADLVILKVKNYYGEIEIYHDSCIWLPGGSQSGGVGVRGKGGGCAGKVGGCVEVGSH